jgi:SpoVK/Ycf46/Vps4 family AAA+-type ATPase
VFIDEVDSLMNKRGSDYSSKSHREIINQFMVEWDGLSSNNQGVIVMAATNRPFDLDDAVLRRMPRRILGKKPSFANMYSIETLFFFISGPSQRTRPYRDIKDPFAG